MEAEYSWQKLTLNRPIQTDPGPPHRSAVASHGVEGEDLRGPNATIRAVVNHEAIQCCSRCA